MKMSLPSPLRQLTLALIAVFSILLAIVTIRTWTFSVRTDPVTVCKSDDADFIHATDKVISRFQKALMYETVSTEPHVYNRKELYELKEFIKREFPVLHSSPLVKFDEVSNYSLLYTVTGSNSSLTPYFLAAHLDVVPVNPEMWEAPPFGAEIRDGFIYARGTIDNKQSVMSILEAVEYLLSKGFKPKRSFYIGFGHDEEVSGEDGAKSISDLLWSRGVRKLHFLVDEGLTIINDIIPGIDVPVALIGTSEKGQVVVELKVTGEPGHSSMPPKETSISILANAITRLEGNSHPSQFGYGPEIDTFQHIAPKMKLPFRVVMCNLWLFRPVVSWFLSRKPSTNAITRTVTSVTMVQGGVKVNVIPPEAKAFVNHRIHPSQTVQEVLEYDRQLINDDRVKMTPVISMEPHPLSPYGNDDFGYQTVKNSIRQIWKEAVVAPGVMIANTDTRHYIKFTKNIYRFSPTIMYPDDMKRFHGNNERISVKNYEQAINFFYHLMINADEEELPPSHQHSHEL